MESVAIVGLGAVGSIYAYLLSEAIGYDNVQIVVDKKRKERYEKSHLYLNKKEVDFNYVTEPTQKADLIIVATKNNQLEDAIKAVKPFVKEDSTFLSLLNGIDSEVVLASHFSKERVIYAFTTALDSTRNENQIFFSTTGIVYFGEYDNSITPRINKIEDLFKKARINYVVPPNIHLEMWAKFMVNVSINTISAITGATYGECAKNKVIRNLIIETQKEVVALAQKNNIKELDYSYIEKYQKVFASLQHDGKTSMLQDIESNRPTENRWFCIRASELAKELGVPTPLIDALGRLLDVIEDKKAAQSFGKADGNI
jgi:2-dehydropantoate 2-reductase